MPQEKVDPVRYCPKCGSTDTTSYKGSHLCHRCDFYQRRRAFSMEKPKRLVFENVEKRFNRLKTIHGLTMKAAFAGELHKHE